MFEWKFIDWFCAKQTDYILNEDGSWSPRDKPHIKDWGLAAQVSKTKIVLNILISVCCLIIIIWVFLNIS